MDYFNEHYPEVVENIVSISDSWDSYESRPLQCNSKTWFQRKTRIIEVYYKTNKDEVYTLDRFVYESD